MWSNLYGWDTESQNKILKKSYTAIAKIQSKSIIEAFQAGATKVYAILTHGIFSGPALQRLESDFESNNSI